MALRGRGRQAACPFCPLSPTCALLRTHERDGGPAARASPVCVAMASHLCTACVILTACALGVRVCVPCPPPSVCAVCPNTNEVWIFANCADPDASNWVKQYVLKQVRARRPRALQALLSRCASLFLHAPCPGLACLRVCVRVYVSALTFGNV